MKHSRYGDKGYYVSPGASIDNGDGPAHCSDQGMEVFMPIAPGEFAHFASQYPGTPKLRRNISMPGMSQPEFSKLQLKGHDPLLKS